MSDSYLKMKLRVNEKKSRGEENELKNINGGSLTLIIAGLTALAVGVVAGVEVADYYLE